MTGAKAKLEYRRRFGVWPREAAGLRSTRHARSTGLLVSVYDGGPAGLDTAGGRWQTVCEPHATICSHLTLALAEAHAAAPEGWCEDCMNRQSSERGHHHED